MALQQVQREQFRLGIAPISWVNDDIPGLGDDRYTADQVLSEIASLGYISTEMGRIFSQDPPSLKRRLEKHGVQLASKFVGVLFSDADRQEEELTSFRQWVSFLKEMGCEYVITCETGGSMHWDPRRSPEDKEVQKLTDHQWETLVEGLHRAAAICEENGLQLVYHFHAGTVVETAAEIDRLMASTDPDLVHLLYDTGHALYGGYDPLALLRNYRDRICYVHLKDVRRGILETVRRKNIDFRTAVLKGLFTVPGDPEGCIDFAPIFQELVDQDYHGWTIVEAEQDPAKAHPYQYAQMAKAYIDETILSIKGNLR
ncbi:myo-inosose-2 dehydratase [Desmospora activa]|uniref:2-keto-myo-inositol dehydratase n=1 Tax=Desmospora activa DSM 45169 TaxID=1121389 RepID=A0A2T4Z7N7_9BACL|nr:myo-inosose-2 dehydratase [Desmospora activa]PTM57910.1 2-keto-myo-inositol dehydratase [Desmospora activa DSM 45169]